MLLSAHSVVYMYIDALNAAVHSVHAVSERVLVRGCTVHSCELAEQPG